MKMPFLLFFFPIVSFAQPTASELQKYKSEVAATTIIRDNWGTPHVYGKTDADAVFGLLYAQCEESFASVEENNLEMMGRLSEIYGESRLYNDLEMQLIYDTAAAKKDYQNSPAWLKKLLDAASDGVNYYLYKHPDVKPKVIHHFEPWFALLRTNGSISATQDGGLTTADMKSLYQPKDSSVAFAEKSSDLYSNDPMGSNGFAVSPFKTASKKAILYINPHVTFYFRSEMEMSSNKGLQAYGGVTWGTFFIFQGFNSYCGWMHTSGIVDVADLFTETVIQKGDLLFTKYDDKLLPVTKRNITIRYKKGDGWGEQTFTTYKTIHGPVMGSRNGQWLSLRENNRSMTALEQSWLRTKAKGFDEFKKIMNLRSNASDNTVFADNKGNIAYWHGNFVPRRSTKYNYSLPVDGSTSATDWQGLFALDSIVHVYNPQTGFIQNCNSYPFTVSGSSGPKKEDYPIYAAPDGENFRGINAARLLSAATNITVDKMILKIGYDHHLSLFDKLIPVVLNDYKNLQNDSLQTSLQEAVSLLQSWTKDASDTSVATAVAIEFGYRILAKAKPAANPYLANHLTEQFDTILQTTNPVERMQLLSQTLTDLSQRFGNWRTTWGEINRYQRPADGVFKDNESSLPVSYAASAFGSIPAFVTKRFDTKKRYGYYGNSFVACVEFGEKVKAKSIITGGQSFDPSSPHYSDQVKGYIDGDFKDVLFYKEDVIKHAVKTYHPGE